jgi:probable rRNA maturation factor
VVLNHQKRVAVNCSRTRAFLGRLRKVVRLGRRDFNVCFVDDGAIAKLNARYRGKSQPTDVLSFPWANGGAGNGIRGNEFARFLGDVVISAETARRNARRQGHSTANEIRWLILHGVLHLLGYDHETDDGEMTALEHSLRERLRIVGKQRTGRRRARKTT